MFFFFFFDTSNKSLLLRREKTKPKQLATQNREKPNQKEQKLREITHTGPLVIPPNVTILKRTEQRRRAPEITKLLYKFPFLGGMGADASLGMGPSHPGVVKHPIPKNLLNTLSRPIFSSKAARTPIEPSRPNHSASNERP
jgi:hypothetical protein